MRRELTVFTRIAFSLSGPVLAAIALFTAVGHWNDWFTGLVLVFEKRRVVTPESLKRAMPS